MEHTANITHPKSSPLWCNASAMSSNINSYDGENWYFWVPRYTFILWYDSPITEEIVDGNVCYKLSGNIWICPKATESVPQPIESPMPAGNIRPMITLTSVKMENHPEHISVMFSQALNNLK